MFSRIAKSAVLVAFFIILNSFPALASTQEIATVPVGRNAEQVAIDSTRGYIYATSPEIHKLWMIDESTHNILSSVVIGTNQIGQVVVNPDTHTLYVADTSEDTIVVLNSLDLSTITSIALSSSTRPFGMAISSDLNEVFAANRNGSSVSVIDQSSNQVVSDISVGSFPIGLAVDDQLHQLYVANADSNSVSIIDTLTNNVTSTLAVDTGPFMVAVNSNNHKVYVTTNTNNLDIIDGSASTLLGSVNIGNTSWGVDIDSDTNQVFVTGLSLPTLNRIDSTTDSVMETLSFDAATRGVAIDSNTHNVAVMFPSINGYLKLFSQETSSPPAITSVATYSTGMRTNINFQVTTTGDPLASIAETGTLPSGVTFTDNGDGTAQFGGSASVGTAGTYPITLSASNGIGSPATQAFTLTITNDTSAPVITSSNSDTESFGVPFSFTVTTTGYPVPKLTKTGALPAGVTFTNNGDGTATIAGTPSMSAVGTYNLSIKAKSSAGQSTQSFSLNISRYPVIKNIPNTKTTSVGTAFSMPISVSAYSTATITTSGTLPSGLSFVDNGNNSATIYGTPAAGSGGAYPLTITATNSMGSDAEMFTLKINESPAITSAAVAAATIGSNFSFQVTTTGYPAATVSKVGTLPKGITFHGNTDTFSGTAKAGTAGTYNITVKAKNSSGTVTQNFVLTVN